MHRSSTGELVLHFEHEFLMPDSFTDPGRTVLLLNEIKY